MAVKVVVFACLVAAVSAGVLPGAITYASPAYQTAAVAYSAPIAKVVAPITKVVAPTVKVAIEEYDAHPRYSFAYDVQDGVTGDSKSQQETRDADVVQGSYSVVDPDATKRTVDYTADPQNDFNALVHREPHGHVAKVAAIAPIAKIAAPVTYSAAPVYRTATVVQAARIAAPVVYSQPIYH